MILYKESTDELYDAICENVFEHDPPAICEIQPLTWWGCDQTYQELCQPVCISCCGQNMTDPFDLQNLWGFSPFEKIGPQKRGWYQGRISFWFLSHVLNLSWLSGFCSKEPPSTSSIFPAIMGHRYYQIRWMIGRSQDHPLVTSRSAFISIPPNIMVQQKLVPNHGSTFPLRNCTVCFE